MTSEINDLIRQSKDPKEIELLKKMKGCNKEAVEHMHQSYKSYKQKYNSMWSKPFWKEGRLLLRDYFMLKNNGKLICDKCKREITGSFTIHHDTGFYKGAFNGNMFTPLYIKTLHNSCHYREHKE